MDTRAAEISDESIKATTIDPLQTQSKAPLDLTAFRLLSHSFEWHQESGSFVARHAALGDSKLAASISILTPSRSANHVSPVVSALLFGVHVKTQTCAQNGHSVTQFRGRAHASRNAQSRIRTWTRGRGTHETRWGMRLYRAKNDVSESCL